MAKRSGGKAPSPNDQRSNVNNPNSSAYKANRDNYANQNNPAHPAYPASRGELAGDDDK